MKSGESFQLTESWWKAGKPALLTDTGLGGALRTFHERDGMFQAQKTYKNYLNALRALDLVNQARLTAIQKCGSNPLFKDAKAALQKDAVIEQRRNIFKAAMTKVIETEVHEIETQLQKETLSVQERDRSSDALSKQIVQAFLDGKSDVKRMVKELDSYSTGASIRNNLVSHHIETEYQQTLVYMANDFPEHANRLKMARTASLKNGTELLRIGNSASQSAQRFSARL